ncbi:S-phase kinase-associated protein 2 isoform X2 [Aplysia californica]|uniref:S-phase kinase-associated protein 2 isoform X2 n=1 Tax=Aplysia californica TaxID=6500 RepID=A0ABM0JQ66_APLCA|nr:S-phase kinase-associated protein 2 isoform X2 [Aplysia californica]
MAKRRSESEFPKHEDTGEENQNRPPITRSVSEKRLKRHCGETAADSETVQDPDAPSGEEIADKERFVTPAIVSHDTDSPNCPGAPRILVLNQGANVENPPNASLSGRELLAPDAFLRTPPTVKSKVYLKLGEETYRGFNVFDKLSDEIILEVFHRLPRHMMCTCALVCRRWTRLVCDFSLWRRLDLRKKCIKPGVLKIVLERGVQILRASQCEVMGSFSSTVHGNPDPRSSPLSEDRMYRVQMLDLSMANVETNLVENLLRFCPRLNRISLEHIPISEALLMNLGQNSPHLQSLNLAMCTGTTGDGLKAIFTGCPWLKSLNISWTTMEGDDVRKVAKALPRQMLQLNISGYREKMTDEVVEDILERCPNLKILDLSDSTEVTDASVLKIPKALPHLQTICLSRCYRVNTQTILSLHHAPCLQSINVFGLMRDPSLAVLEEHMSKYRINKDPFSSVARPTPFNSRRHLIWGVSPSPRGLPVDPDSDLFFEY